MNRLTATVTAIEAHEALHMITLEASGLNWSVQTLQLPAHVSVGRTLTLSFNANDVLITSRDILVGVENSFFGTIEKIDAGSIMTRLHVVTDAGKFYAMVSRRALAKLDKPRNVALHIAANNIALSEHS